MLPFGEVPADIIERVGAGEPVSRIACELGVTQHYRWLLKALRRRGIRLTRGRRSGPLAPAQYRMEFNRRHRAGAAEEFLRLSGILSCAELAERFGLGSRARVYQVYRRLSGNPEKPKPPPKLIRTDVTAEAIRRYAKRGWSARRIAQRLKTNDSTVRNRAKRWGIQLAHSYPLRRPDITRGKLQRAANSCNSIVQVARRLNTDRLTVVRKARAFGIELPNELVERRCRAAERRAQALALQQEKHPLAEIARCLHVARRTARDYLSGRRGASAAA